MSFLGNYVQSSDPDGSYFDSTRYRQRKKPIEEEKDEIDLNNSSFYPSNPTQSSVEITDFTDSNNTGKFFTTYGKPPVKKIPDKVYPKNGGVKTGSTQKNTKTQQYFIEKEPMYAPKKKVKFKKHYEKLEWYLTGTRVENPIVNLKVSEIIARFGAKRAIIRDIIPVWGHSTLLGHSAKITCTQYPGLNRDTCTSNIEMGSQRYFASVCAGMRQDYKVTERADVLQISKSKKGTVKTLLDYMDQNECYPFKELVENYDKQMRMKEWLREMKKDYRSYPKSGMEYIKNLIAISKDIPLSEIEKMEKTDWIKAMFKTRMDDPSISEGAFINPEGSKYVQFLSGCPFYEGLGELRYFTPIKKDARVVSLPRHKQVLRLLKMIKEDQGMVPLVPFKLVVKGRGFGMKSHYNQLPCCVTLKVCVKVSVAVK